MSTTRSDAAGLDGHRSAPGRSYVPSVDGLRGVTCLLVIVMHAAIVTGEVGVVGDGTLSPVLSRL
ncbi:hypothetical protein AB4212_45330, partial [Streptomyces sp. 2MCAF27]